MPPASSDHRHFANTLHDLLARHCHLKPRYAAAKAVVRRFRRPAFYEVATRCNLRCEGCYYFADGYAARAPQEAPLAEWDAFFQREAARGVSMAYFIGAEPALEQERLLLASRHLKTGNIGTNGSIRLDPEIRFRIGVSVWAASDKTDQKLRGASVFRKALRNYQGDPRAIMLYTVSHWNIEEARDAAQMCRDHGVPLTFNLYSPTRSFLSKLQSVAPNDEAFFRVSSAADSPCFTPASLARARDMLGALIDDYPDTVIYSHAYNRWATEAGGRYALDEDGVARNCGSRMVGNMQYFTTVLRQAQSKCGTPDVDCSQCRIYSGGWSSKFAPQSWNLASVQAFEEWLEMIEVLGRIFILPDPCQETVPQPYPVADARSDAPFGAKVPPSNGEAAELASAAS